MQFKHKFMYFCAGCAFVVMAQVLLSVLAPQGTARGTKEPVVFDTVKVRSLQVVDNAGKVRVQLGVTNSNNSHVNVKSPLYADLLDATMDDVIRVFNSDGVSVYEVATSSDGAVVLMQGTDGKGSVLITGVSDAGGCVIEMSNDFGKRAMMGVVSGMGMIEVHADKSKSFASMYVSFLGGLISVSGNGAVSRWDTNGFRRR